MSYKKFTKDVSILILTQIITTINGIITLPVITKILGPENYGIWALLMAMIGFIGPIALLGFPYTLVRFLPGEKDKRQIQDGIWSSLSIILCTSLVASLLLFLFSRPIAIFLGSPTMLVQLLALIIIFELLNSMFLGVFRAFQQIKRYCLLTIIHSVVGTALVIASIVLGHGLIGAIASMLAIKIILFAVMGGLVFSMVGFKIPEFLKLKEYLRFGLPNILGDIAAWITASSDRFFIGFFLGTVFVGYYAPAYTLGTTIVYMMGPLTFLLPATLSKHYDTNEMNEVKSYLKHSLKIFLMLSIPSFFGLTVLSKNLLTTLSTSQIAEHSYYVVPIIALGMLLTGAFSISSHVAALKKKTHIIGLIAIFSALLNFGLNFVFVPLWGILGAAITTFLAYGFTSLATWHYCFKQLPFEVDWKFVLKSIFASAVMATIIYAFNPVGIWNILAAIMAGVIIYGIVLFLLGGLQKSEITFMKTFFKT